MKKYSDMISGAIILLVSAILFYGTTQIRVIASMEGLTSKFFPRIVVGGLALMGLIIFYRGFKASRSASAAASGEETAGPKKLSVGTRCAIETMIAILIYVCLMEPVGFLITTFVYLIAQMLILAPGKVTKKTLILFVIISLIASTGIYFLFTRAFYLLLPAGILG